MRVLSLYCGGGGIDEGLKQAGITTTTAIDTVKDCCETMRLNHPDTEVIQATVEDMEYSLGKYDMVVGGPPCPEFSYANIHRTNDASEVNRFWRIVKSTGARHAIMENVRGVLEFLPPDARDYKRYLINTANYGVPQIRLRAIVTDLPEANHTHSKHGDSTLFGGMLKKWVSIRDALELDGILCDMQERRDNSVTYWKCGDPAHTVLASDRYMYVPTPDYILQDRKQQRDPDKPRNRSVDRPSCTIHTDSRLWLLADVKKAWPQWAESHVISDISKPSKTILAKDYGATDKLITDGVLARKLRVDELAVLQGFPAAYVFAGSRTSQVKQIGNALPPTVTKAFAENIEAV